jgi:hypothetical protein
MSFDPKSYELAEYFLADNLHRFSKAKVDALAQHIQEAVEDWLSADGAEPEPEPAGSRDRDEWRHEAAEAQRLK